jgi:glycosyltransferase involved in cell wall biosynthesis
MRIAIVALNAYPAVNPQAGTAIGGLETFAWLLARGLATRPGHEVQFLVRHTANPTARVVEQVQIAADVEPLRPWRLDVSHDIEVLPKFPWLRFKHLRPSLLWKVPVLGLVRAVGGRRPALDLRVQQLLEQMKPDLVLTLGAGDSSAAVVRAAAALKIPSLLWLQSNADLDPQFQVNPNFVDPYGVTSADARASWQADRIICQTRWQQQRVFELLNRDSEVIPNPLDATRFPVGDPSPWSRQGVLWIGRYDRHHKRPHLALEIAKQCPRIPFRMVINRGDPAVEAEIRAQAPPNVQIIDYLSRDEMPKAFREARLFLSTGSSAYEGFPNVLLEAAASGTPIVSMDDFDEFLTRSQCGILGTNAEVTAKAVMLLTGLEGEWVNRSRRGAEYVRQHHSLPTCLDRFEQVISP